MDRKTVPFPTDWHSVYVPSAARVRLFLSPYFRSGVGIKLEYLGWRDASLTTKGHDASGK